MPKTRTRRLIVWGACLILGLSGEALGVETVLVGSALPQDQGWLVSTNQSQPDVSTNGSTITVNTIGTPEGGAARLIYYKDVGVGGKKYWVEIRLKLDAMSATHNPHEAGLAFYGSFDPAFPSGSEANKLDMVYFDPGQIGFGLDLYPDSVNTMDNFHTYRFEYSSPGGVLRSVRVYRDGVLQLITSSTTSLIPNGVIAFGDMTSDENLNSTFQVESIVVFRDCNGNNIEDSIDLANGAPDCNFNNIPDECEADCNSNDIPDDCDLASGLSQDCDFSGIIDVCEVQGFDCNTNQVLDSCDIASGFSLDADGNGYPDECPQVNPPALLPDPTGYEKSRFISFLNSDQPQGATAIRIWMNSLHHVNPPYGGGSTIPITIFEGQSVWIGPPASYYERISLGPSFWAAQTQCMPHYRDWTTVGLLHVTGAHIVPSSVYEVEQLSVVCRGSEESCTVISPRLEIHTARWGDVEDPYNPPSLTTQPNLEDVSALIGKFKCHLSCITKARALLAGDNAFGEISTATLTNNFGFSHIAACIDAFKGKAYPSMMGKCAGPPFANSQCTGPANPQPCCTGAFTGSCNTSFSGACTTDSDCTGPAANGAGPCSLYCP